MLSRVSRGRLMVTLLFISRLVLLGMRNVVVVSRRLVVRNRCGRGR